MNYVRIIAKRSLVELQPKAFTSENTRKLLKNYKEAVFKLVKASILINKIS